MIHRFLLHMCERITQRNPPGELALKILLGTPEEEHTAEAYAKDAETVAKDLRDLKELLEAD